MTSSTADSNLPKPKLFVRLSVLTLIVSQCFVGCNNKKDFQIEIRHFAANAGMTLYYTLNDHFILVETQCSNPGCKKETIYKRVFLKGQSDSVYEELLKMQLDTLRLNYRSVKPVKGGLVTSIKMGGDDLPNKIVDLYNARVPATDTLFNLIDRLILAKDLTFP